MNKYWTREYWHKKKEVKKQESKIEALQEEINKQFAIIKANQDAFRNPNPFWGIDTISYETWRKPIILGVEHGVTFETDPSVVENPGYSATVQLQIEAPKEPEEYVDLGWGFDDRD